MKTRISGIILILVLTCLLVFNVSSAQIDFPAENSAIEQLYLTYGSTLVYLEKYSFKELAPEQIKAIQEIQNETLSKIVSMTDKYSRYHTAEEWKEIQEEEQKEFEGVGLILTLPNLQELNGRLMEIIKEKIPGFGFKEFLDVEFASAIFKWIAKINPEAREIYRRLKENIIPEDGLLIEKVIPNSPAEKAGIQKGWYVLKVDGKKVEGLSMKTAVNLIRGLSGTKVKLTLAPPQNKARIIEIERGSIASSSVGLSARMLSSGTGYIALSSFYEKSDADFKKKVNDLKNLGMKKMIIDLRNNPGGDLMEADKILEILVPAGKIEIYIMERDGQLIPFYSPPENKVPKIFSGKIVVLINENSASASELVAVSLKEQVAAMVIGKKSYGKGSVQTLFPLPDGSVLRLTTAHYLSPLLGEDIEGRGIAPDIEIKDNPDTPEDEVIQKAIEVLNN